MLSQYLDSPVLFSGNAGTPVTFETPVPIPRRDVLRMLRGLVESQGLELVDDSTAGLYRVRLKEPPRPSSSVNGPTARPPSSVELFVIPLKHARAVDVASTVNALYGRGSTGTESSARVPTLSDDLRNNLMPPVGAAAAQGPGGGPLGRPATLSGELTIVADSRGNSLLVRANAQDIELIRAVVDALDVRPLQVLIEVMVAEVRRDRSIGINVEGVMPTTPVGTGDVTAQGSLGTGGLGDFALKVMGIGGVDLDATLRLAAGRGDVKILTRPVVLATNNQLAEIIVGSQRPFVQVQRSLPTDAAARDQIVQYKDVGTKLTVRPTISGDGSVQLEVTQEVSTATAEVAFNAPVIATRSLRTQLLVRDGQTVALGGLTDRVRESRQSGIPILSSIPLLGGLFGGSRRSTAETELFVFLTPRVIRTDDDAMRLAEPLKAKAGTPP
jgi:general secretion pathway protein D